MRLLLRVSSPLDSIVHLMVGGCKSPSLPVLAHHVLRIGPGIPQHKMQGVTAGGYIAAMKHELPLGDRTVGQFPRYAVSVRELVAELQSAVADVSRRDRASELPARPRSVRAVRAVPEGVRAAEHGLPFAPLRAEAIGSALRRRHTNEALATSLAGVRKRHGESVLLEDAGVQEVTHGR